MFSLIESKTKRELRLLLSIKNIYLNLQGILGKNQQTFSNYMLWLVYFISVVYLEWTIIVWIYYFLIKQDLQFSVLQRLVTVWNFYCQLWHLVTLKLVKRNRHMIVSQLHVQYFKCPVLTHLNTCYLHYIYQLMKLFTTWGTR